MAGLIFDARKNILYAQ